MNHLCLHNIIKLRKIFPTSLGRRELVRRRLVKADTYMHAWLQYANNNCMFEVSLFIPTHLLSRSPRVGQYRQPKTMVHRRQKELDFDILISTCEMSVSFPLHPSSACEVLLSTVTGVVWISWDLAIFFDKERKRCVNLS